MKSKTNDELCQAIVNHIHLWRRLHQVGVDKMAISILDGKLKERIAKHLNVSLTPSDTFSQRFLKALLDKYET